MIVHVKINWDIGIGIAFAGLGALLIVEARTFPAGTGGVPGPGFFPFWIGVLLTALGTGLALGSLHSDAVYWEQGWTSEPMQRIGGVVATVIVYLILWNSVPFLVRTPLLLLVIYRIMGESWLRSAVLAGLITAASYGVFGGFFNVRL